MALGVSTGVTDFFYELLITGPTVKLYGQISPHRVYGAGWIGVGYAASGGFGPYIGYSTFIDLESMDHRGENGAWFAVADTLFWDLHQGVTCYIEVDW
jgi:hypothetical protein